MDEYMGVIKLFAGNFVPQNYLMCNGNLLSISQYTALFAILGTTYGGDGRTTFALPDLRGQVAVGAGQSKKTGTAYVEGQASGSEVITLLENNLPPHIHNGSMVVSSTNATDSTPVEGVALGLTGEMSGRAFVPKLSYVNATPNVRLSNTSVITTPTGAGVAVENMQPYLALNYIICVQGLFPPRP